MHPTTIALVGPAGSGKSTAAAYLVERYGARRYSFAAPLKEIARRALNLTSAQVYGSQADKETVDPRYGFTPRWFLQRLGTEGVRSVLGDDFWCHATLDLIAREGHSLAVIEDARFTNECALVRQLSVHVSYGARRGLVLRLHLPPGERLSIDDGSHASEREWRDVRADAEVAPAVRGLAPLYATIDGALSGLGLARSAS